MTAFQPIATYRAKPRPAGYVGFHNEPVLVQTADGKRMVAVWVGKDGPGAAGWHSVPGHYQVQAVAWTALPPAMEVRS